MWQSPHFRPKIQPSYDRIWWKLTPDDIIDCIEKGYTREKTFRILSKKIGLAQQSPITAADLAECFEIVEGVTGILPNHFNDANYMLVKHITREYERMRSQICVTRAYDNFKLWSSRYATNVEVSRLGTSLTLIDLFHEKDMKIKVEKEFAEIIAETRWWQQEFVDSSNFVACANFTGKRNFNFYSFHIDLESLTFKMTDSKTFNGDHVCFRMDCKNRKNFFLNVYRNDTRELWPGYFEDGRLSFNLETIPFSEHIIFERFYEDTLQILIFDESMIGPPLESRTSKFCEFKLVPGKAPTKKELFEIKVEPKFFNYNMGACQWIDNVGYAAGSNTVAQHSVIFMIDLDRHVMTKLNRQFCFYDFVIDYAVGQNELTMCVASYGPDDKTHKIHRVSLNNPDSLSNLSFFKFQKLLDRFYGDDDTTNALLSKVPTNFKPFGSLALPTKFEQLRLNEDNEEDKPSTSTANQ